MNWTAAGTVPMTQKMMMSFRDWTATRLGSMVEVSKTGEHPLKWGYYFTLLIKDTSPF